MKQFLVVCISTILFSPSFSQTKKEVDFLNQQSNAQRNFNTDSVEYFAELALSKSRKIGYVDGEIDGLINVCFARYIKGNNEGAVDYCSLALDLYDSIESSVDISGAYLFLGLSKVSLGKFNEAIDHFLPIIDIANRQQNDYLLSDACSNIGLAYVQFKNYSKALEYYRVALKIHKNIEHPHGLVYVYQNVGRIFFEQTQYDSAEYYFDKTIKIAKKINNQRALYYGYLISGQLPYESADDRIRTLHKALELAKKLQMEEAIGYVYFLMSGIHMQENSTDSLIHYSLLSEEITSKYSNNEQLLKLYHYLSFAYSNKGDVERKTFFGKKYEQTLDKVNKSKSDYYSGLIDANEMMDDERSYVKVKGKLNEAEARILQKNIIILGTVLGLILIAIILLVMYKANQEKSKSNRLLKTLNDKLDNSIKEKDLLMGMIVHDLRSPLSKIQGLIEIFNGDKSNLNASQIDFLNMIGKIVVETKDLAEELLEVNQLESGSIKKNESSIDIKKFIDDIIFHYESRAKHKGVELLVKYEMSVDHFTTDKFMLQRIIENLISNAIKFNGKGSIVNIRINIDNDLFTFAIKDNGPGIPEEEQELLFKKFGKTSIVPTANESSTGLGLYIVKNLIDNLNGQISFVSKLGLGVEFKVNIPA